MERLERACAVVGCEPFNVHHLAAILAGSGNADGTVNYPVPLAEALRRMEKDPMYGSLFKTRIPDGLGVSNLRLQGMIDCAEYQPIKQVLEELLIRRRCDAMET